MRLTWVERVKGATARTGPEHGFREPRCESSFWSGVQWVGGTLAALAFALTPRMGEAQRIVDISDRPVCRACEIRRMVLPALGDESGGGIIESEFSRAIQDSRGRVYLAGPYASQILVFDSRGRFVRRIGRLGGGPGEFNGVGSFHVGPGDSLFVLDNPQSRLSVFSPDFEFVRSIPLALAPEVENEVLSDGSIIIGRSILTPDLAGHPLHLLSSEGTHLKSFGNLSGIFRPDVANILARAVSPSAGPFVWSGRQVEYTIDRINTETGRITQVIRRTAPWFPSRMRPQVGPEVTKPEPMVTDLQEDEAGRLWVLLAIPDREWRKSHVSPSPGAGHGTVTDWQGFYDTRIEVLDPERGRLIASLRIPEYVERFSGPREIGRVLTENGVPRFLRWRLALLEP